MGMKTLLSLIEYKSGKNGSQVAEDMGKSRQTYSKMKNRHSKDFQFLVDCINGYNLEPNEVIEALRRDYSKEES